MGHHPGSAVWDSGGHHKLAQKKLTDAQCRFLNDNLGVTRRTLRHVHLMFNERFETDLKWDDFKTLRTAAIKAGRCRTTYIRNYHKIETSSERELRLQRPYLKSRITGGCQYREDAGKAACGASTLGRFCERHVQAAFADYPPRVRGADCLDSSLGKYG